MPDFDIQNPNVFSDKLRKFETTDKAHADLFNKVISTLINNDAYLNEKKANSDAIIDTKEAIQKNDQEEKIAGALAVKQIEKELSESSALKSYTAETLGINSDTTLKQIVEGEFLPKGGTVELWINDDTAYGREVRQGINSEFGGNFFGFCYITRVLPGSTRYLKCVSFNDFSVYGRSYTTTNSLGWMPKWKRIDIALENNLATTASGRALDARQGKALKDLLDSRTNNKVRLYTDTEGGNIDIISPDKYGDSWQMDAYDGNFRIYHTKNGKHGPFYKFPKDATDGVILTDAKLANNAVTTAAGYALDARQGKWLKGLIDTVTSWVNTLRNTYATGSALKVMGVADNLIYGAYDTGLYYYGGHCAGAPSVYTGYMLVLRQSPNSNWVRIAFSTDGRIYYLVQKPDATIEHGWRGI